MKLKLTFIAAFLVASAICGADYLVNGAPTSTELSASGTYTAASLTGTTLSAGAGGIALENGATIKNGTNNAIAFGENSEDLINTFSTNAVTLSSSTGVVTMDMGAIVPLYTAGTATAAAVERYGQTATEGTEITALDEDVTLTNAAATNLTNTVPSGAVILSVQANLETTVVGDASGDNGMIKVGIGTSGDPDKYGLSADLVKNTKVNTIPDWAVLSGAEQIAVNSVDTGGTAATEKFVGGEIVRVRVVYLTLNSLDNAP